MEAFRSSSLKSTSAAWRSIANAHIGYSNVIAPQPMCHLHANQVLYALAQLSETMTRKSMGVSRSNICLRAKPRETALNGTKPTIGAEGDKNNHMPTCNGAAKSCLASIVAYQTR
jgi:hypothetical protein